MNRTALVCTTVATLGLVGSAWLTAGPLTPPPGAVTSTYKTLSEVEPRTPISGPTNIIADGSYYLTGNITGPAGGDAITISAINVTLDLNGYTITGGQTGVRIAVLSSAGNLTIKNGTIRNTTGSGVFSTPALFGSPSVPTTVRNLRLYNIADTGVLLGPLAVIENVSIAGTAGSTTSAGSNVGAGSRLVDVRIETVAGRGIDAASNSLIDRATVITTGLDGIRVGGSSRIANSSTFDTGVGFNLGAGASIINSTASSSNLYAFQLDAGATARQCAADNTAGDAFLVGPGGTVTECSASNVRGNAFVASSVGGATFDRCTAFNIEFNGFQVSSGSAVTNSTVSLIGAFSTFSGPVSSGVLAIGSDNRIEGNRFVNCGYPVFIPLGAFSCSVYRNSATACTNSYSNFGGPTNLIGPIRTNLVASGPWDNTFQ